MTADQDRIPDAALYREDGASWWVLLFGPCFALVGLAAEYFTAGPVFFSLWVGVAIVLVAFSALWVYARRQYATVLVTETTLRQGQEELAIARIAEVSDDVEAPQGTRVLGGGMAAPRKYDEVPLLLVDGSRAVAWARDGDGLRAALRGARTA